MYPAIVVLDDDELDLELLRACHERAGVPNPLVTYSQAETLLEYLSAHTKPRPGFVLLDIRMPGMNGFEVAERIRERDAEQPLGLFTTSPHPLDGKRARELGIPLFQKPAGVAPLIHFVKELVQRMETADE